MKNQKKKMYFSFVVMFGDGEYLYRGHKKEPKIDIGFISYGAALSTKHQNNEKSDEKT